MTSTRKACFVCAGTESTAAAALPIRDSGTPGGQIPIQDAHPVFPFEFPVRAAQIAAHRLSGITRSDPPVTPHDKSLHARCNALIQALK